MKKHLILPTVTILLIFIFLSLFMIPNTREFITGLVVGDGEKYFISGQIKIITPVELHEECNIDIELEKENTKEKQEKTISAEDFKEKSEIKKEAEFFIYLASLKNLTKDFILEKGSYFLTIKVFCDNNLISQVQEYFTVG